MFQLPFIQHKRYFSYTDLAINFVNYLATQHRHSTSLPVIGWETGVGGVVNSVLEVYRRAERMN